jgi:phosphate transport system protein
MDRHFDSELNELKEKLISMSALAEDMIAKSIAALKDRREDYINQVFEKEKTINNLQIEVDDMSMKLIALRQPAASDLRFLVSAIKINSDLERIGDLAVNIVERVQDLLKEPSLKPLIDLPKMAEISQGMVKDAITSFINRDPDMAKEVCKRDDLVDNLNSQLFRELLTYMLADAKNINRAIDLLLVARHLERIADHATNISEDVFYMVKGQDIRHHHEDTIA